MSDDINNQSDESARRSHDGDERRADANQPDTTRIPLLTRDDLTPDEAAELGLWQMAWEHGTVSDEEFAGVMQRIYTQMCERFGLEAVTMEEARQAVQRLRTYLDQQPNNDDT